MEAQRYYIPIGTVVGLGVIGALVPADGDDDAESIEVVGTADDATDPVGTETGLTEPVVTEVEVAATQATATVEVETTVAATTTVEATTTTMSSSTTTTTTTEAPPTTLSPIVGVALAELDALTVAEPAAERPPYIRDAYDGDGWADVDGDCLSTRHELLIADSLTDVVLDASGCRVESGMWVDPYTFDTYTSEGEVSIDHVVPLAEAHRAGAWRWDSATKSRFSNDELPGHLVVVGRDTNQSKADQRPDE